MKRAFKLGLLGTIILAIVACSDPAVERDSSSNLSFYAGEHLILGNLGYKKACQELNFSCAETLRRKDRLREFSYGDLVAFGDFYGDPKELYFETDRSFFAWDRNNISAAKSLFELELQTIEKFSHGHSDVEYPYNDRAFAWYFPNYLHLSLNNEAHFGFYNMKSYISYHQMALDIAVKAHNMKHIDIVQAELLLEKALVINGFADHFLTDGFASGHIRNPRRQIKSWVHERGLRSLTAEALAKIIHDRDGEVRESGEHGLLVKNSRGNVWFTRCDSQLFWQNSFGDPAITLPIEAVAASVKEVLRGYLTGEIPSGIFAATWYVPFIAPEERRLTDIFYPGMPEDEVEAIARTLDFFSGSRWLSGFTYSIFDAFVSDLPSIMESFRQDIAEEIEQKAVLSERLPYKYLDGFKNIY